MKKFCTACGNVGIPLLVKKGSTGTAFLLWITFLLPGIIYSIWRANSEHETCPACGSPQIIPVDSPISQKLMGDDYRKMKEEEAQAAAQAQQAAEEKLRQIREQETKRLAQPWLKRNGGNLAVALLCILFFGAILWGTIFVSKQVPVPVPVPQETKTIAAPTNPFQKKPHKKAVKKISGEEERKALSPKLPPQPISEELRTKCIPFADGSVDKVLTKTMPLPPKECRLALGWMRDTRLDALYDGRPKQ